MTYGNITYHQGDIFSPNTTGHELVVCHQVNCKGVMGAGLAKQIRGAFPQVYAQYKMACDRAAKSTDLLGTVLCCSVNFNGYDYTIANLFGQDGFGRDRQYTDYDALRKALSKVCLMAKPLPAHTLTTVRIPYKMGCGLGGGDWDIVIRLVIAELVAEGISVEIWKKDEVKRNELP